VAVLGLAKPRLQQEAQAATALNHPNIITVYEIGNSDGVPAAESRTDFAGGRDRNCAHVAAALSAAHEEGIVHRDIKPESVMVRPDGLVRVLDFGLAQFVEQPADSPAFVLGTVRYMSPEQSGDLRWMAGSIFLIWA